MYYILSRRTGEYCETYYNDRHGCPGLGLDVDNTSGGNNGAETITWETAGDFVYLLFVYDYSNDATHLVESGARIAFYGSSDNSSQVVRMQVDTVDPNSHSR